ncbi:hypothetical protein XPN_1040 [Xanthomonas arboricola pv. pruni MAFF 301427]|nr:hypothetical protein XPN_1040 [Xanthomonas arboricola pv. pruni MAFF 301427]
MPSATAKLHDTASIVVAVDALLLDGFVALDLTIDALRSASANPVPDNCTSTKTDGAHGAHNRADFAEDFNQTSH